MVLFNKGITYKSFKIKWERTKTTKQRALEPWVAYLRMTDQWSGTFCEILVECIRKNNSVK